MAAVSAAVAAAVINDELLRASPGTRRDIRPLSEINQTSYKFSEQGETIRKGVNRNSCLYTLQKLTPDAFKGLATVPWLPTSFIPADLDGGFSRARHTVWLIFNETDSLAGLVVFIVVFAAIILSVIAFCLQTMPEYRLRSELGMQGDPEAAFELIEKLCVGIFTFDYLGRVLTLTSAPNAMESAYIKQFGFEVVGDGGRRRAMSYPLTLGGLTEMAHVNAQKLLSFVISPLNVIDLAAIIPFYVSLGSGSAGMGNIAIIRVLRLARVARLLRLTKGMEGVTVLFSTILAATDALGFLTFFVMLACILFGAIMFFCEEGTFDASTGTWLRPNLLGTAFEPSPFRSIPHAMWYAMVTMTTVGYGDYFPTTDAGKVVGTVTMVCGIMVLALPITVVGGAFTEEYAKLKERVKARTKAAEEAEAAASSSAAVISSSSSTGLDVVPVMVKPVPGSKEEAEGGEAEKHPPAAQYPVGGDGTSTHSVASAVAEMLALVRLQSAEIAALRKRVEDLARA